ncbi:MAG: lantibiotic dehydratase [Bacteroidota bacterium]
MTNPFYFTEKLVFRSPALSFIDVVPENIICHLLSNDKFLEAVYIASPVLYKQCIKLRDGKIIDTKAVKNLHISIIKYYQRMYSRCTPFGLFAGCGIANWRTHNTDMLAINDSGHSRQTRLDMYYLCQLAFHLSGKESIKNKISWYPNTSLYKIAGCFRYIEYEHIKDKRLYKISEAQFSTALEMVLERSVCGLTIAGLKGVLGNEGHGEKEAEAFIQELIASQILVSDLEPAVTGQEPLDYVIGLLQSIAGGEKEVLEILIILEELKRLLAKLDGTTDDRMELYKAIIRQLDQLDIPYDENRLFQVDMYHSISEGTIDPDWQNELMGAFDFLSGISANKINKNLDDFSKKFKERYDEQWVPLNEILDTDIGIGYADEITNDYSQLIEGLMLPASKQENAPLPWNSCETWLLQKLVEATVSKSFEVGITREDLEQFPPNWEKLPPSMSVMFSSVENERLVIDGIMGSSAANLLGRFAGGLEPIGELVDQITTTEQLNYPDAIFAEILHLPESRTGNILLRPQSRSFEIPFLARFAGNGSQGERNVGRIPLNDLLVSVKEGSILLYSISLRKQIVPRLGTAHNFSLSSLPVYRFLCDLQGQNLRTSFRFSWGILQQQFVFLPRVTMGRVILSEATWQFKRKDIEELTGGHETESYATVSAFFDKWKMPPLTVLVDGDNELLINLSCPLSIDAFIKSVKGRQSIVVKEYFKTGNLHSNKPGFACQFIAPIINGSSRLKKNWASDLVSHADAIPMLTVQRRFIPGSDWVYAKLYCGIGVAERCLATTIRPLVFELSQGGYIKKWFFIRYNEGGHHLRIRFEATDQGQVQNIVAICNGHFKQMDKECLVNRVEYATYDREIERYGETTIGLSESVFCINSSAILEFVSGEPGDEARWLWGIQYADMLLHSFGFSLAEKCSLLFHLSESFLKEFKADKPFFIQINNRYREVKRLLFSILDNDFTTNTLSTPEIKHMLVEDAGALEYIAAEIDKLNTGADREMRLRSLVSSYLHMHFNRLFLNKQRVHEMVVYEYMNQYYRAKLAIANQVYKPKVQQLVV